MTTNKPFVSAVVPCYNSEHYIKAALESLLAQTRLPDEIVVIDDASTDNSWEIIQALAAKHSSIEVHKNEHNLGTVATRNKLLSLVPTQTSYVAILDSDDISLPNRLEVELDYLEQHPELAGCSGAIETIDQNGAVIGQKIHQITGDIARYAICWNPFVQSAMMLHWKEWQESGAYDETLTRGEDHEMWLRMLSQGQHLAVLSDIVVQYRVHPTQGKWAKSKESMRSYGKVRARYLFKPQFFSLKALLITSTYFIASLMPASLMVWIYKNIYARKK